MLSLKNLSILLKKPSSGTFKRDREIEREIWIDRVNYARISSYCALFVMAISTAIGFVGIILVLQGQIAIDALTSIGGFLTTNGFVKIAAEANHRLDRMMEDD